MSAQTVDKILYDRFRIKTYNWGGTSRKDTAKWKKAFFSSKTKQVVVKSKYMFQLAFWWRMGFELDQVKKLSSFFETSMFFFTIKSFVICKSILQRSINISKSRNWKKNIKKKKMKFRVPNSTYVGKIRFIGSIRIILTYVVVFKTFRWKEQSFLMCFRNI